MIIVDDAMARLQQWYRLKNTNTEKAERERNAQWKIIPMAGLNPQSTSIESDK